MGLHRLYGQLWLSLCTCTLLVLMTSVCKSQFANSNFEHLTSLQGLSSEKVEAVLQDRDGFYWIATQNGLNRYDGTSFKVFRTESDNSASLSHNYCTALAEGADGDIWVATYKGISRYIRNKGCFQTYYLHHPSKNFELTNRVYAITSDGDDNVWIAGAGLWQYDAATDSIYLRSPDNADPASPVGYEIIKHLVYDRVLRGIWISAGNDLAFFSTADHQFYRQGYNPKHWKVFDAAYPIELALDSLHRLWFRDRKTQQLSYFDVATNTVTRTGKKIDTGVKQIQADDHNRIWIFYWQKEAGIFDPVSEQTDTFFTAPGHPRGLMSQKANSLYIDDHQNYWISSDKGISIYNERNQYYSVHDLPPMSKHDEKTLPVIKAMAQNDPRFLWIATDHGLVKYALEAGKCITVIKPPGDTLINSICAEGDELWLGAYDQLLCFNTLSGNFTKKIKLEQGIFFIEKGDHRDLWIGLWTKGLYRIDLQTNEIVHFQHDDALATSMKSNSLICGLADDAFFWTGYNAGQGFSRFTLSDNTFLHFHPQLRDTSVSNAGTVTVMAKDANEMIWIGTHGSGIFRYDIEADTFENFQQQQGLSSNYINSILPDPAGNLWISTADGLNYYQAHTHSIRPLNIAFIFPDNDFSANGLTGMDGHLFFFCKNEIVEIHPEGYQPQQNFPKVVISSFRIFDQEFPMGDQHSEIRLQHRQNFFTFEFSALQAHPSREIKYAYMLDGFDDDWHLAAHQNIAAYTNVPEGHYRFLLKVTNEEGEWSDVIRSVPLRLIPPFWHTWWFISLCSMVAAFLIYAFYQYRIAQIKNIFSMRTRISQDLHDDIGGSLSSINIFSAVAAQEAEKNPLKTREFLSQINTTSREVMENISDIVWANIAEHTNNATLSARIKNYGHELLAHRNIECHYRVDPFVEKKLTRPEARRNILLIIKEALNNMAKYSGATSAEIQVSHQGGEVLIDIRDNGKGFDPAVAHAGNGLRNMQARTIALKGDFHVKASPGLGTAIHCRIPLPSISESGSF